MKEKLKTLEFLNTMLKQAKCELTKDQIFYVKEYEKDPVSDLEDDLLHVQDLIDMISEIESLEADSLILKGIESGFKFVCDTFKNI